MVGHSDVRPAFYFYRPFRKETYIRKIVLALLFFIVIRRRLSLALNSLFIVPGGSLSPARGRPTQDQPC